jgi:hypothetical protein
MSVLSGRTMSGFEATIRWMNGRELPPVSNEIRGHEMRATMKWVPLLAVIAAAALLALVAAGAPSVQADAEAPRPWETIVAGG